MGLRSWWADQKRALHRVDEERAAARTRVVEELEPIIDAEASRGNPTIDHWHNAWCGPLPDMFQLQRGLRYPLDEEAIRAEFDVEPTVFVLKDNAIGLYDGRARLFGGEAPTNRERAAEWTAARERWWEQWRAGPQRRRKLSKADT